MQQQQVKMIKQPAVSFLLLHQMDPRVRNVSGLSKKNEINK